MEIKTKYLNRYLNEEPSKTMLIIDDEISIRDSLASFFEDEGYFVFTAENGESGLNIFFNETINIVITDLRMPKKDGIEVMKTIHKTSPDIPMIVVSGAGKKEDIIRALRMGAKDYITKPIDDLDMIRRTVRQVLENSRLSRENKQYRKQLEKSESRYRTITENIAEGVFTVDEFEKFTYTNQAFCTMMGYSNKDILQKTLEDLTTRKSFKIIQQETQNRKNKLTSRYEIQLLDKNRESVHVELSCSPIFSDDNHYQGAIAVARDITDIINLRKKFLSQKNVTAKNVLPVCASCKSIKVKKNEWIPMEDYFSDLVFSHGICPACCDKLYPEFDLSELDKGS